MSLPGGPVGLFLTETSSWRSLNCNSIQTALSTLRDSLQVIDNLGIIAIDRARKTAWNAIFAEFGGTAQPAVPTGAPGLRTTLRRLRSGMDLGAHSSFSIAAQLGVRFPGMPGHEGSGRRAKILAVYLCRDVAVVVVLQRLE